MPDRVVLDRQRRPFRQRAQPLVGDRAAPGRQHRQPRPDPTPAPPAHPRSLDAAGAASRGLGACQGVAATGSANVDRRPLRGAHQPLERRSGRRRPARHRAPGAPRPPPRAACSSRSRPRPSRGGRTRARARPGGPPVSPRRSRAARSAPRRRVTTSSPRSASAIAACALVARVRRQPRHPPPRAERPLGQRQRQRRRPRPPAARPGGSALPRSAQIAAGPETCTPAAPVCQAKRSSRSSVPPRGGRKSDRQKNHGRSIPLRTPRRPSSERSSNTAL